MLKFATIGTSWITSSFIEAALADGRWDFAYAYSRDIDKAKGLLRKYNPRQAENGAADSLNGLARLKPDAVYIASPNALHREQAVFLLTRGINVICEKPAVISAKEWEAVENAAVKNDVYVFEALRHVYSPGFDALRQAVDGVGPVRNAIFSYNQYSSRYDNYLRGEFINIFDPRLGGGALNDLGVYPVSLAAALWGAPQKVQSSLYMLPNAGNPAYGGRAADGAGAMILDYGTFLCSVVFSKIADGIADSEIYSEDGNIVFDKPHFLSSIRIYPRLKNTAMKTRLSDFGKTATEATDVSRPMAENKMTHEAAQFADVIINGDRERYKTMLKISRDTHTIMDMARTGAS